MRNRQCAPCGISAAETARAAAKKTTSRILVPMLALRKAFQPEHLDEGNIQIHGPDPADRPAQVHVVPKGLPLGEKRGEVVVLPGVGPGENQQEKADFEAERDE